MNQSIALARLPRARSIWCPLVGTLALALSLATAEAPTPLAPPGMRPVGSLEGQLIEEEGLRLKPYRDSRGNWTIGVGHNLRNGLTLDQAMSLLRDDIDKARLDLREALPWVERLSATRQNALVNLTFNLGVDGLLSFKTMLSALKAEDYAAARTALLSSKWRSQVGEKRALRIGNMLSNG